MAVDSRMKILDAAADYGWVVQPLRKQRGTPFAAAMLLTNSRNDTAIAVWFGPGGSVTRAWVGLVDAVRRQIADGPGHTRDDLAGGRPGVIERMRGGAYRG